MSKELRDKLGRFTKGHIHSKMALEKIIKAHIGKKLSKEHKQKIKENNARYWKGKHLSESSKEKNRISHLGKATNTGKIFGPQSKEWIKKRLRRNPKSSLEIKFESIIEKLNLPYHFVGNGEFFVLNKCPDFIHQTNQIAIEVYFRKHKEFFKGGVNNWKEERKKLFNSKGWDLIFFDESEVNEEKIKTKLAGVS